MYRDVFTKLARDIDKLDPNEITIVTYDKHHHTLTYRQLNQVISIPYMAPYFLPKKGFKWGALTQSGLMNLKVALAKLLSSGELDQDLLIPDLQVFGLNWYKTFHNVTLPTPQIFINMKFVNVMGSFMTWMLCHFGSNNAKIIYKSLVNERKFQPKFESDESDKK